MLQVGEVARQLGLNPQTLYFYERIGLIPSPKRTEAGYRLFAEEDVERLSFIQSAKALGLSLEEIKELLTLQDGQALSCEEVYQRLLKKVEQIEANIQQLQALKAELLPLAIAQSPEFPTTRTGKSMCCLGDQPLNFPTAE